MAAGALRLFGRGLLETGDLLRARTVAVATMVLFRAFHVGNRRSAAVLLITWPRSTCLRQTAAGPPIGAPW